MRSRRRLALFWLMTLTAAPLVAQEPDWAAASREALAHLQKMIRLNTVNPPGNELQVARFLDSTMRAAGIETHLFEPAPGRSGLVAPLKGDGSKQPVLTFGLLPFPMNQDDEDCMHGNDERLPLASLEFGTRMIYSAIARVAR